MAQKEIIISINSTSFTALADEFEVQSFPYRRQYRIESTNDYFQKVFGDSCVIVSLSSTRAFTPGQPLVSEYEHNELLEAVYEALTEELATSI